MTRRQLFKNFGFGLAGLLALPLFGKPGKASEPGLSKAQDIQIGVQNYETHTFGPSGNWGSGEFATSGSPSDVWGNLKNEELSRQIALIVAENPLPPVHPIIANF